jgi:hypothetical protein
MNWHTFPMGGAANERTRGLKQPAFHSHAVNTDTWQPLCSVKLSSLTIDDSIYPAGCLPDCPKCQKVIKRL